MKAAIVGFVLAAIIYVGLALVFPGTFDLIPG